MSRDTFSRRRLFSPFDLTLGLQSITHHIQQVLCYGNSGVESCMPCEIHQKDALEKYIKQNVPREPDPFLTAFFLKPHQHFLFRTFAAKPFFKLRLLAE